MCFESENKSSPPSFVKSWRGCQLRSKTWVLHKFEGIVEHRTSQTLNVLATQIWVYLTYIFYDYDVCGFSYIGVLISEMAIGKPDETGKWVTRYSCGRINVQLNFLFQEPADRDISFLPQRFVLYEMAYASAARLNELQRNLVT